MTTDAASAIAAAPTSRPRTNRLRAFSLVAPSTLIPTPLARRLAVGPGSRRRRQPVAVHRLCSCFLPRSSFILLSQFTVRRRMYSLGGFADRGRQVLDL